MSSTNTIGALVAEEVKTAVRSFNLDPTTNLEAFSKHVGQAITDGLISQEVGLASDAEEAYYAAARRLLSERFDVDNVDSLLNGLYAFCLSVNDIFKQKWEGSEGSQGESESLGDMLKRARARAEKLAAVENEAGSDQSKPGLQSQITGISDDRAHDSQQLADVITRVGESLEERIKLHCDVQNFKSGMDANALREQILDLPIDLIITNYTGRLDAAVIATRRTTVKDGVTYHVKQTDILRGDLADSAIAALESLFRASMHATGSARNDLQFTKGYIKHLD
ncbi:hypothetical protein LTR95_012490 [Oleoguttula sp. CCFEE 5521]